MRIGWRRETDRHGIERNARKEGREDTGGTRNVKKEGYRWYRE
jgi:hypothetical protein